MGQGDISQYGSSFLLVDITYIINKNSGYNKMVSSAIGLIILGGERVQINVVVYLEQIRDENIQRLNDNIKYSLFNGIIEDIRNRFLLGLFLMFLVILLDELYLILLFGFCMFLFLVCFGYIVVLVCIFFFFGIINFVVGGVILL